MESEEREGKGREKREEDHKEETGIGSPEPGALPCNLLFFLCPWKVLGPDWRVGSNVTFSFSLKGEDRLSGTFSQDMPSHPAVMISLTISVA